MEEQVEERTEESAEKRAPKVGDVVLYRLSENDAAAIATRRASDHGRANIAGNEALAGDAFPMIIARVWDDDPGSAVNGQVILDGQDTHWATSVRAGAGPGSFSRRD